MKKEDEMERGRVKRNEEMNDDVCLVGLRLNSFKG